MKFRREKSSEQRRQFLEAGFLGGVVALMGNACIQSGTALASASEALTAGSQLFTLAADLRAATVSPGVNLVLLLDPFGVYQRVSPTPAAADRARYLSSNGNTVFWEPGTAQDLRHVEKGAVGRDLSTLLQKPARGYHFMTYDPATGLRQTLDFLGRTPRPTPLHYGAREEPVPSWSNALLQGNIGSQACAFGADLHSGSGWSIYSFAGGNCSSNIAARTAHADGPQNLNAASEEVVSLGFECGNLFSAESEATGTRAVNIASRWSAATSRNAVVLASQNSVAGRGRGLRIEPIFERHAGAPAKLRAIKVIDGGEGYPAGEIAANFVGGSIGDGTVTLAVNAIGRVESILFDDGNQDYASPETAGIYLRSVGECSTVLSSLDSRTHQTCATVISSQGSIAGATSVVVLGAKNVVAGKDVPSGSLVMGYSETTPSPTATASQGILIQLEGRTGDATFHGTVEAAVLKTVGHDYAELFENAELGEIPPGTLLGLVGRRVRAARPGDRLVGVVSKVPSVIGNCPAEWPGKYARDEWGALITAPSADGVQQRQVNSAFDSSQRYLPRTERPAEWTVCGMMGQLPVRVDADVSVGDSVRASVLTPGIGSVSDESTGLVCVGIQSPYDEARKFAIATCLVRAQW